MAKKKDKGKGKGFLGKAASFLGSIPSVGDVAKKAKTAVKSTAKKAGNAAKATAKKAKTAAKSTAKKAKKAASSAKKKIKKKAKKAKKKLGKVYTKARKTANNLSKSKMVKQVKQVAKKAVLTTKKAVKKTTAAVKKKTKKVIQDIKNTAKQALVVLKPTKKPEKAPPSDRTIGKKIEGEAELKAFFNEYLKNPRPTDDKITYEGMRKVVGGNGSGTIDGLFPIVIAGYEFYVKDFVTLANPNATLQEQNEATLSILSPFGKARKVEDLKDTLKKMEKGLEGAQDLNKNANKGKEAQKATQKEIEQLGEYLKNLDKGTGNIGTTPRYGDRQISDELYNKLRKKTPTKELQDKVNEGVKIPMDDPVLPGKTITKRLEPDHIVSVNKISRMEGFEKLTEKQQLEVLNNPENFTGLSRSANGSKQDKSFEEWTHYKKDKPGEIEVDPAYRDQMMKKEKEVERNIQKQIDDLNRSDK